MPSKTAAIWRGRSAAGPAPPSGTGPASRRAAQLDEGPAQRLDVRPRWRPARAGASQSAMAQALPAAHCVDEVAPRRRRRRRRASASSTWCPSDSHRSAAARTAATQSGCDRRCRSASSVRTAMRSRRRRARCRGGEGRAHAAAAPSTGRPAPGRPWRRGWPRCRAPSASRRARTTSPPIRSPYCGRQRVAPAGRLEPDQAAARRGDADGAARRRWRAPPAPCPTPPRRPSRPRSRRSSARCSTGCAWRRSAGARSSAECRARACSSCRR